MSDEPWVFEVTPQWMRGVERRDELYLCLADMVKEWGSAWRVDMTVMPPTTERPHPRLLVTYPRRGSHEAAARQVHTWQERLEGYAILAARHFIKGDHWLIHLKVSDMTNAGKWMPILQEWASQSGAGACENVAGEIVVAYPKNGLSSIAAAQAAKRLIEQLRGLDFLDGVTID